MDKKTLKLEILDPRGEVVRTHHFEFHSYEGNKLRLTIADNTYIMDKNGRFINRITPEPQPEEEILLGSPKDPKTINWDGDEIFVIRYQALSKAHAYFTGENYDNAKKFLKENEDRYLKLTKI